MVNIHKNKSYKDIHCKIQCVSFILSSDKQLIIIAMKTKNIIPGFIFLFSLVELHGIDITDGSPIVETIVP